MKITSLRTYLVAPRWCFLRVDTDEGVTGWGEPVVEGRAHTVAAAVDELSDYLVGQDPMRIEDHWQVLTKGGFYRGGPILSSAVAGIDQALWDIKGKALGVPVWQLLGGNVRDRARVYSWIGGDSPADVAEQALARKAEGFTAIKMNASPQLDFIDTPEAVHGIVDRVARIREAVGDRFDIAVDFHGRLTIPMARRVLPLLEPYLPFFVEEPVVPELSDHIGDIVRSTSIPIATGERLYSRWDFKKVLSQGVAIAQPDLSHAGGISEVRRIAAMAEAYDTALAPHCPLGPIALAACLQVGFASPNLLIQEQSLGIHYNAGSDLLDYLVDPSVFRYENGHVELLTEPGLGIRIDEKAVEHAAETGHRWRNPVWRRKDGALAEW
ncbi:galactonate dehydratase [Streptomyces anulatus]|uniref:galactonate dehydratase n=1 Tax=Streptomyces anulatus TaxID=1892 RepID=UPI0022566AED|nr:galactonate dehydratase [Streptomyces anulatus]MCX4489949.1 galactonate dehydratase [Streptomyces anulatus]